MLITLPYFYSCVVQLLQNIVKSTELQFPSDSNNLSSECKDLCQKLLRRNPGISVCVVKFVFVYVKYLPNGTKMLHVCVYCFQLFILPDFSMEFERWKQVIYNIFFAAL